jgi:hypothetical protein
VAHLPELDPTLRDKVRRLMGAFRQLAVAKTRPIRSTDKYHSMVLLADADEYVQVRAAMEPGEEILRVERTRRDPEPVCSSLVQPWVVRPGGSLKEPVLRDRLTVLGTDEQVAIEDRPAVARAFDAWLGEWRAWAVEERRRRSLNDLFQQLFDMQRLAQERPESIELVVASGLLHAPSEQGVRVHLITQPVSIERDDVSGAMVCSLLSDSEVRLESEEVLSGLALFDQSASVVLRERLLETVSSPLDPAIVPYLKEWADRALLTSHRINDEWSLPVGPATEFGFAPALVARRRGAFALREYYDSITRSLADEDVPVPLGLAQLVEAIEPDDRLAWLERTGGVAAAQLTDDPLFPLPANDDQAQIIHRLGQDSGVVVEGPPGTGKTHTIANLVSALLAQGQRVLVTAEKSQALRVLRDKLPEQMQELCVSLTDASAKGNSDLSRSVAALAAAKTDFNPSAAIRRINDLESRRVQARSTRSRILEDIRSLRESETYRHPEIAPGYSGTLANIAQQMAGRAETDGWVPGRVTGATPLSKDELSRLMGLLRSVTEQRRSRRNQQLPASDALPTDLRLANLVEVIARGEAAQASDSSGLVAVLSELPSPAMQHLDGACRQMAEATAALRAAPTDAGWASQLTDTLLAGTALHLWQRATEQLGLVDDALELDRLAGFSPVAVASSVNPEAAAGVLERFAAHLSAGGSVRRVFKSDEQKAMEALGDTVLVSGARVTDGDTAIIAARHLRALAIAQMLAMGFAPLGLILDVNLDRSSLVERLRQLRHVCALIGSVLHARDSLAQMLSTLPASSRPPVTSIANLELIVSVTIAVNQSQQAALARVELDQMAEDVLALAPAATRPPELTQAANAIKARDEQRYGESLQALEQARHQQREQHTCDELEARLSKAAPTLRTMLIDSINDPQWATRLTRWAQSWAWACARTWIDERNEAGLEERLDAELDAATRDLTTLTGELAAAKAWKASMERMNARQVQALQSYRSAMSNVGGGTGRYAERFRQAAREAMVVAQEAVPAWVMPVRQVLDSIPAKPNTFDVVIVDEASQAELTSSFLLWLAPRVIVVGDDKQCTPSEVSAGELEPIFRRLETELPDIPQYLRADLTPRSSIFSMLRSRFGQMVRLREHFRCMPEIINWSSNEFYRDAPLIPVRDPRAAIRCRPTQATPHHLR